MKILKTIFSRFEALSEANALLEQAMAERAGLTNQLHDLIQTHAAEIAAITCEVRCLKTDIAKRNELLAKRDEENYELRGQLDAMVNQVYNYVPEEPAPLATEDGGEIVCFSSRLKSRGKMN